MLDLEVTKALMRNGYLSPRVKQMILSQAHNPRRVYFCAKYILKDRWPNKEDIILSSPKYSYYYSWQVIQGRWEEAEEEIAESSWALDYFEQVLDSKWPPLMTPDLIEMKQHLEHTVGATLKAKNRTD